MGPKRAAVLLVVGISAPNGLHSPTVAAGTTGMLQNNVERRGDSVYLQGEVNQPAADRLIGLMDENVRALVVTSGGGDGLSAIRIGREVSRRRIEVVVNRACMSACAQFIFVAARQRYIQGQSLVVFHNTSSSMLRMIGADADPQARAHLTPVAEAEQAFYKDIGLPVSLLYQPQIEIGTSCYRYSRDPSGNVKDVEFKSDYRGWIPDRSYMDNVGLGFQGWWPETKDEAASAFHDIFTINAPVFLRYGGSLMLSEMRMDEAYAAIGVCQPDIPG